MERERPSVVFFDIGDTLGAVRRNAAGDRIVRIRVLPGVTEVLRALRQRGARLGIISNRGRVPEANVNQALVEAGLFPLFTPDLIFYGPKDSTAIFLRAAEAAGHGTDPQRCLFVGENQSERQFAAAAGLLVAEKPEGAL
jgi:phosphoglycolate phosphatase-like HAD superfamily hydrolase